jgi:hypothetical protein
MAEEKKDRVCETSAQNIDGIISEWYSLVKEFSSESKNKSVILMHMVYGQKQLKEKFNIYCNENFEAYEDIYLCFSGIRSELGAAMCLHPDTNKNNWEYR